MTNNIARAREFAVEAHAGQQRAFSDLPYIVHPAGVYSILSEYRGPEHHIAISDAQLCAAFLHDVLEDTDTTSKELEVEFGHEVTSIVEDLTIDDSSVFDKNLYLKSELCHMSSDALTVKLADRLHNMLDLPLAPKGFLERYAEETKDLIKYVRYHRYSNNIQDYLFGRILDSLAALS